MDVVVLSLVEGDGHPGKHGRHLGVEEVNKDTHDYDGHETAEEGLVDGLLTSSEGWGGAEQVHPPNGVSEMIS